MSLTIQFTQAIAQIAGHGPASLHAAAPTLAEQFGLHSVAAVGTPGTTPFNEDPVEGLFSQHPWVPRAGLAVCAFILGGMLGSLVIGWRYEVRAERRRQRGRALGEMDKARRPVRVDDQVAALSHLRRMATETGHGLPDLIRLLELQDPHVRCTSSREGGATAPAAVLVRGGELVLAGSHELLRMHLLMMFVAASGHPVRDVSLSAMNEYLNWRELGIGGFVGEGPTESAYRLPFTAVPSGPSDVASRPPRDSELHAPGYCFPLGEYCAHLRPVLDEDGYLTALALRLFCGGPAELENQHVDAGVVRGIDGFSLPGEWVRLDLEDVDEWDDAAAGRIATC